MLSPFPDISFLIGPASGEALQVKYVIFRDFEEKHQLQVALSLPPPSLSLPESYGGLHTLTWIPRPPFHLRTGPLTLNTKQAGLSRLPQK